jgi:hypothetical protein
VDSALEGLPERERRFCATRGFEATPACSALCAPDHCATVTLSSDRSTTEYLCVKTLLILVTYLQV